MPAHVVYRMYDAQGQLLYIGASSRGFARLHGHASTERWAAVRTITVEHHDTRHGALLAEAEAIRAESPLWNVQVQVSPLAQLRNRRGWSQEGLAAHATTAARLKGKTVRVSPSAIAMIETGKRQPSLVVAEAIAAGLGVPVEALGLIHKPEAA
jgi:DNA-binding XRE family transcriptional regulator